MDAASQKSANGKGEGGVSIDDFLVLKYKELFQWFWDEREKTGMWFSEIRERLPKYYETIVVELKKMADACEQGTFQGIEEAQERAKKLFSRAVDRLKQIAAESTEQRA